MSSILVAGCARRESGALDVYIGVYEEGRGRKGGVRTTATIGNVRDGDDTMGERGEGRQIPPLSAFVCVGAGGRGRDGERGGGGSGEWKGEGGCVFVGGWGRHHGNYDTRTLPCSIRK